MDMTDTFTALLLHFSQKNSVVIKHLIIKRGGGGGEDKGG